jgi:hypothetical protein
MLPKFAVENCVEGLLSDQRLRAVKRHLEGFGVDVKPAIVGYIVGGLATALNYSALTSGESLVAVTVEPLDIRYNGDWGEKIVEAVKPLVKRTLRQCEVELTFFLRPESFWKHDVDNLAEVVLNSLQMAGVYHNDTCVVQLLVSKHPAEKDEAVHIIIRKKEEV